MTTDTREKDERVFFMCREYFSVLKCLLSKRIMHTSSKKIYNLILVGKSLIEYFFKQILLWTLLSASIQIIWEPPLLYSQPPLSSNTLAWPWGDFSEWPNCRFHRQICHSWSSEELNSSRVYIMQYLTTIGMLRYKQVGHTNYQTVNIMFVQCSLFDDWVYSLQPLRLDGAKKGHRVR